MKRINLIAGIALATAMLFGCKKDENGYAPFSMRMMDAPAYAYDEVNVEVKSAEAHIDNVGWVTLNSHPGVYNLLTLTNGTDVLIADERIPEGTLSQVRLNLGTNNTIKVDGQVYPLIIPSGQSSGLKIQVHETIRENQALNLMLDFDAAQSVEQTGNGTYHLKPVIRAYNVANRGAVKGRVVAQRRAMVMATSSSNVNFTTYTEASSGKFLLRGLVAGTYTIKVYPGDAGMAPVVINNVTVGASGTVDIGEININIIVN